MILRKSFRRWIFITISLAGIGYELTQKDNPSWPLLAGYTFVIAAAIYSLQLEKHDDTEESE